MALTLEAHHASLGRDAATVLASFHEARVVTRSRTTLTECGLLETASGPLSVYRKTCDYPDLSARLRGVMRTTLLASSRSRRERGALLRLRDLGPPDLAPEPVALEEERRGGFLVRSRLWVLTVDGAADLDRTEPHVDLADALGTALGRIHGARLGRLDAAPRNFLAARRGGPWHVCKVDTSRMATVRPGGSAMAEDLGKLLAGLESRWEAPLRQRLLDAWSTTTGWPAPAKLEGALTKARKGLTRRAPRP
jgi:tRNA A-37 threonylcarbamoyl transferase component Bud32